MAAPDTFEMCLESLRHRRAARRAAEAATRLPAALSRRRRRRARPPRRRPVLARSARAAGRLALPACLRHLLAAVAGAVEHAQELRLSARQPADDRGVRAGGEA